MTEAFFTAVHEAAHAVAAEAVGYTVTGVTIDETEARELSGSPDALAFCGYRVPSRDYDSPAGVWRLLKVTVAGKIAEHRIRDLDVDEYVDEILDLLDWPVPSAELLDLGDGGHAAVLLLDLPDFCGDPRSELLAAIEAASEILTERWGAVEELASRLVSDCGESGGHDGAVS